MVYMDTNESNTHADIPLGSRWAQMWVHMWTQTMVRFLVYVTKGNIYGICKHRANNIGINRTGDGSRDGVDPHHLRCDIYGNGYRLGVES